MMRRVGAIIGPTIGVNEAIATSDEHEVVSIAVGFDSWSLSRLPNSYLPISFFADPIKAPT